MTRNCIHLLFPHSPSSSTLSLQDKNVGNFDTSVVQDTMDIPRHLDSAAPTSATPSGPIVTQEAEDEIDAKLHKLQLHIRQAEYVHTIMTVQVKQLERKLAEPKDEEVMKGKEHG